MPSLGSVFRNQNYTNENTFSRGDVGTLFNFAETTFSIRSIKRVLQQKNIAGDILIWNHPLFGQWGEEKWGVIASGSFILGHPGAGLLGTSRLGSQSSAWTQFASANVSQKLTNTGREAVRDWLAGSGNTSPCYTGIGTGTTAYAVTQTALISEVSGERNAITTATGSDYVEFTTDWNSIEATGNTYTEFGIFDATGNGNMFSRITFPTGLAKTNLIEMRFIERWEFTNAKPMMNRGVQVIRDWVAGAAATAPTHMAWGSGTTAVSESMLTMTNEEERNLFIATGTSVDYRVDFEGILAVNEANTKTIRRTAIFNAAAGGDMYTYAENPNIAKTARFDVHTIHKINVD